MEARCTMTVSTVAQPTRVPLCLIALGVAIVFIGIALGVFASNYNAWRAEPTFNCSDSDDDVKLVHEANRFLDQAFKQAKQSKYSPIESTVFYCAIIVALGLVSYEAGMFMFILRYRARRSIQSIILTLFILPMAWYGAKLFWHQRELRAFSQIEAMGGAAMYPSDFPTLFSQFVTGGNLSCYRQVGVLFLETKLSQMDLDNLRDSLNTFSTLGDISLVGTTVDDSWLEHLRDLHNIQYLSLENTSVTDEGIRFLKGWSNLSTLHLDASNRITNTSLEYLQSLPKLMYLGVSKTDITDAAIEQLHQKNASLQVTK
jgi:hypothetical protein